MRLHTHGKSKQPKAALYRYQIQRLAHGCTNQTLRVGVVVVKTYAGPDAAARLDREDRALQLVRDRVPVPPVLDRAPHTLTLGFVTGRHGQDLITAGHAEPVLAACGSVLHDIHCAGVGHGDFGPQNLLLDAGTFTAVAVLDWEFAAIPLMDNVADLAWCEWIVRMHHPEHVYRSIPCSTVTGPGRRGSAVTPRCLNAAANYSTSPTVGNRTEQRHCHGDTGSRSPPVGASAATPDRIIHPHATGFALPGGGSDGTRRESQEQPMTVAGR